MNNKYERERSLRNQMGWPIVLTLFLALMLIGWPESILANFEEEEVELSQSVADLNPDAIYAEAKHRGIDLLARRTEPSLRKAFVRLHSADSGSQLLADDKNLSQATQVLASGLAKSGLTSIMRVRTSQPGAQVKYKLIGASQILVAGKVTNSTEERVTIGLYNIWAERNSKATSSQSLIYRVIQSESQIDLVERQSAQ